MLTSLNESDAMVMNRPLHAFYRWDAYAVGVGIPFDEKEICGS
jgi:hypothetical protein